MNWLQSHLFLVAIMVLAVIVITFVIESWWSRAPVAAPSPAAPAAYSPPGFGLLALSSLQSLVVGAIIDFCVGLVLVYLVGTIFYLPIWSKIPLALLVGTPLYLWSLNLHEKYLLHHDNPDYHDRRGNYVPPFERGIATRLGENIPSGPDGKGLRPGYHWFPLGVPIYGIFKTQSVKEMTIPFKDLQVWTKNTPAGGAGAIEGLTDGIAQFQIDDLAAYYAVAKPEKVLKAIVLESARDVCENETMEQFLSIPNEDLAKRIFAKIEKNLGGRLGGHFVSVNVKKTDNRDAAVKAGYGEIARQRSLATARKTDADARVQRIEEYKAAGVDANRAAALDAVVDGHAGATVGDQRYNVDVGKSLNDILAAVASKFAGGKT